MEITKPKTKQATKMNEFAFTGGFLNSKSFFIMSISAQSFIMILVTISIVCKNRGIQIKYEDFFQINMRNGCIQIGLLMVYVIFTMFVRRYIEGSDKKEEEEEVEEEEEEEEEEGEEEEEEEEEEKEQEEPY